MDTEQLLEMIRPNGNRNVGKPTTLTGPSVIGAEHVQQTVEFYSFCFFLSRDNNDDGVLNSRSTYIITAAGAAVHHAMITPTRYSRIKEPSKRVD